MSKMREITVPVVFEACCFIGTWQVTVAYHMNEPEYYEVLSARNKFGDIVEGDALFNATNNESAHEDISEAITVDVATMGGTL